MIGLRPLQLFLTNHKVYKVLLTSIRQIILNLPDKTSINEHSCYKRKWRKSSF